MNAESTSDEIPGTPPIRVQDLQPDQSHNRKYVVGRFHHYFQLKDVNNVSGHHSNLKVYPRRKKRKSTKNIFCINTANCLH